MDLAEDHKAVYSIYCRQLFGKRHGLPLWEPEPKKSMEVSIGDVGYLMRGGFYRIFNATLPKGDPSQVNGAPVDHVPWVVSKVLRNETKNAVMSHLCSHSVTTYSLDGKVASNTVPIGGGLKFKCSQEQGAFCFVHPPADRTQLHPSKRFAQYMKNNIEKWHELASNEDNDLDVRADQLLFVSGFVKTNDWGIGAFMHEGTSVELMFQTQLPFVTGSFGGALTVEDGGNTERRLKPPPDIPRVPSPRRSIASADAPSVATASTDNVTVNDAEELKKDQCLFLHMYKIKRHIWWRRIIKAAAGPDELDPDDPDEGDDSAITGEDSVIEYPPIEEMYNPVDILLDYILNYPMEDGSQVDYAIASDLHLYQLFDGEVPVDIKGALEKLKPPVMFLDDDREVAALACAEWGGEFEDLDQEVQEAISAAEKQDKEPVIPRPDPTPEPQPEAGPSNKINDDDNKFSRSSQGNAMSGTIVILQEHTAGAICVACSPDGRYLASGSEDTHIVLREAETGDYIDTLKTHNEAVWSLTFSPDSRYLVSGASDGVALLWDIESRQVIAVMDGHTGVVQRVAFTPDGKKIVTAAVDFVVRVWDARTGVLLHTLEGHSAIVTMARIAPNGQVIASCAADYKTKIWNADTGALLHTLDEHTGVVWALAFAPDSKRLITASDDTTARIWDAVKGEELVTLCEHSGPVWGVSFSPDGRQVLTAGNDATIKVCDSFSGERKHAFDRRDALVGPVLFSPDGTLIVSSGADNSVVLWSLASGKSVATMNGHLDKVTGLAFSPSGHQLYTSSDDGTVRIWTLPELEPEEVQAAPALPEPEPEELEEKLDDAGQPGGKLLEIRAVESEEVAPAGESEQLAQATAQTTTGGSPEE